MADLALELLVLLLGGVAWRRLWILGRDAVSRWQSSDSQ